MVKVRIRRLLLDAKPKSFVPLASYPEDPELEQFLEMEQLHRLNECLVASSRNIGPHTHGVEDLHGGRFWALGYDSDSESEEEESSVVPVAVEAPGFADPKPSFSSGISETSVSVSKDHFMNVPSPCLIKKAREDRRPWQGPLPKPRRSPMITFGNALSKARVFSKKSYSWSDARSSGPRRSPCFSVHSSTPRSVPAHSGNGGTDVACSNFKNKDAGSGAVLIQTFSIKPGPHVSFRPTKGLVSLFARTRTKTGGPRAPITRPSAAPFGYTISYAEALVGNMDGGGRRSGEDGTGRGSSAGNRGGRTNGQGSLMNHSGFRLMMEVKLMIIQPQWFN
jgi:hypothetical protein